jgi:hypothetical protein
MLPMVAMLVAGYMAKQRSASAPAQSAPTGSQAAPSRSGAGGVLGGLLGGGAAGAQRTGAPGGLASMLDMDGDGNPLDDILRMAGKRML